MELQITSRAQLPFRTILSGNDRSVVHIYCTDAEINFSKTNYLQIQLNSAVIMFVSLSHLLFFIFDFSWNLIEYLRIQ